MPAFTNYTILNVNEGTVPNDGTGDPLRTAFDKVNDNFSNIANFLQQTTVDFPSANITVGNLGNVTVGNIVGNITVDGFMSVTKDVFITGNLVVANTVSINNQQLVTTDPLVFFDTTSTFPYNYDIGFYSRFRGGPANVVTHTGIVRRQTNNQWTFFSNVQQVPTANDVPFSDPGIRYDTIYAGNLILANTQQSAGTTTGVLTVAGGAGIAGNLHAGNVFSGGARVLTTASAGVGNIFSGSLITGNTLFTAATVSTSATSGAILVPNGGIGVGGNSFFGGNVTIIGNIISTGTISTLGTLSSLTVASTGTISIGTTSINQNTIGVTNLTAPSGIVNFTSANINFTNATLFNVGNISAAGVNAVSYGPQFVAAAAGDVSYFPILSNVSSGVGSVSAGGDFSFNPTRDLLTVPNLNGTGNVAITNFSAANAVVLGATTYIGTAATQIANIRAVEGRFNNLSSANVFLSGGYATGLANVRATELQATNFSTGNALLSGTTVATNFSTANVVINGGYIQNVANLQLNGGTTAAASLRMTPGALLSAATAGAVEFDGNLFYATQNTVVGRGSFDVGQYFYVGSNVAGTIGTTLVNPFGVGPQLIQHHVYDFEYCYYTAVTTGGNIAVGIASSAGAANPFYADVTISTVNLTPTSGNTSATVDAIISKNYQAAQLTNVFVVPGIHAVRVRGTFTQITANGRATLQANISAGSLSGALAGSWFRFSSRGYSANSTGNVSIGSIG